MRVQDDRSGPVLVLQERIAGGQRLAADGTAATLAGEELHDAADVGRLTGPEGGGARTRREARVGLVERHPLAVLGRLAPARRKGREAFGAELDSVAAAVGRQALAEDLGRQARPAARTPWRVRSTGCGRGLAIAGCAFAGRLGPPSAAGSGAWHPDYSVPRRENIVK
jgi:hypothetical protein